jgi:hypothetical protein
MNNGTVVNGKRAGAPAMWRISIQRDVPFNSGPVPPTFVVGAKTDRSSINRSAY